MLRWYGRRERPPRPRLIGCLLWLIALIVLLIVASLLFGGFTKGTKVSGAAPLVPMALHTSPLVPTALHASPPPR